MSHDVLVGTSHAADTALPCQTHDPELFFADAPAAIEVAKAVCGACPLRQECLAGALRRAEPHGVWGGELLQNGQVIARKRPRGRPRKQEAAELEEPAVVRAA